MASVGISEFSLGFSQFLDFVLELVIEAVLVRANAIALDGELFELAVETGVVLLLLVAIVLELENLILKLGDKFFKLVDCFGLSINIILKVLTLI